MTRRLTLIALLAMLAFAAFAAFGCGTDTSKPVEMTEEAAGSTQTLAIGQELVLTLESNPSTGYRWDIDGALPQQLEQVGEPEYASESTLAGAPGKETWTFKGKSAGSAELKMKYWRSFEPTAEPERTFAATINVE